MECEKKEIQAPLGSAQIPEPAQSAKDATTKISEDHFAPAVGRVKAQTEEPVKTAAPSYTSKTEEDSVKVPQNIHINSAMQDVFGDDISEEDTDEEEELPRSMFTKSMPVH